MQDALDKIRALQLLLPQMLVVRFFCVADYIIDCRDPIFVFQYQFSHQRKIHCDCEKMAVLAT